LPQEMKTGIRLQLLGGLRTHGRFRITADHVFHQCMLLDLEQPEVIGPISEWTAKQMGLSKPHEALPEILRALKLSGVSTYKLLDLENKLSADALLTDSYDIAVGMADVSPSLTEGHRLRLLIQGVI